MTTYKRIDGDFYIQTVNPPEQKVYIDTDTTVTGNLTVQGNLTYINVDELNIRDPFILLNSSNTGSYAANSGILTHETASLFAGIRYNANTGVWELSVDTTAAGDGPNWTVIATGPTVTPGGVNTNIQFNNNGAFGGNSNLNYDTANSKMTLDGTLALAYAGAPSAIANTATVTSDIPGSGGTGIYFNNNSNQDELISKSKAIVFSIIF